VKYVSNYTDIDDKMITRAEGRGMSVAELASDIAPYYERDFEKLRIRKPDVNPWATKYIEPMIELIAELEKKRCTYIISDGVYFDISKFPEYGKLSGQSLDELQAGSRKEVNTEKRNHQDFVLWKFEKPGEPAWESPWGRGRPGWHIECSAMVKSVLGQPIDIHGGGLDLTFPHHECEIAQSEAAYGVEFARYWLHNGFVNINKEKMSKSLHNFITLEDVLKVYDGRVVRFLYLQTHYRSPLDFSDDLLAQSKRGLERIDQFMKLLERYDSFDGCGGVCELEEYEEQFQNFMDNDFDVPGALGVLFSLITRVNDLMQKFQLGLDERDEIVAFMKRIDSVFALLDFPGDILGEDIAALVAEREEARRLKNFTRSDEIRDTLKTKGIVLEDTPSGVMWRRE
jgi:cysteinyl-tRNA synthetase